MKKNHRKGPCFMKDGTMKAVLDEDLDKLLESLGVYDSVVSGNEKCFFCGKTVTLENLSSIFPLNREVKFCCDDLICVNQLTHMKDD